MAIHIEKATAADLPALQLLYIQLCEEKIDLAKAAAVLHNMLAQENYHLLVARESTGRAIGTAMGVLCLDLAYSCDPFMLIENVVVLEEFRAAGVGKRLMDELERIAQAAGCSLVMLVSGAARESAHTFYKNLGYAEAKGFKKRYW